MKRLVLLIACFLVAFAPPAAAHPNHGAWFPSGCYNPATPVAYQAVEHIGIHSESSYVYATSANGGASWSYFTVFGPVYGAWAANRHECGAWGKPTSNLYSSPAGGGLYRFEQFFEHRRINCYEYGNNYPGTVSCASFSEVYI